MKMSELVTGLPMGCSPAVTLSEAAAKMIEEGVGSLAVFDGEHLVGIVTDRDLVRSVADSTSPNRTVREVMTVDPDTVDGDLDIADAVEWLNATGYRHLPVTEGRRLLGIVSIKDLLSAVNSR